MAGVRNSPMDGGNASTTGGQPLLPQSGLTFDTRLRRYSG